MRALTLVSLARSRLPGGRRLHLVLFANQLVPALVVMAVYFELETGVFLSRQNLTNIATQSAILMVVTMPLALVVLAGGVDLSLGSVAVLGGVVAAKAINGGLHELIALGLVLLLGAGIGSFYGLVSSQWGVSPLILTFGGLTAFRGLALGISPQSEFDFGSGMREFGTGRVWGVPWLVLVALGVVIAVEVVSRRLPVGRHLLAIGVSERSAFLSGIAVNRIRIALYTATGAAATLGGFMFIARINSAPAGTLALGLELDALTACLLGGIAFGGGRGSPTGALLGVLTLGFLQNGLQLMAVSSAWALVAKGIVLAIAAGLQVIHQRVGAA